MYQIKTNFISAVSHIRDVFMNSQFIGEKKEKKIKPKKVLTFIHLMFYFKEDLPSPKIQNNSKQFLWENISKKLLLYFVVCSFVSRCFSLSLFFLCIEYNSFCLAFNSTYFMPHKKASIIRL